MPELKLPPFLVERVQTALSEQIDWGLNLLHVPDAWRETKGAGVRVAVLDTGIDQAHLSIGDLRNAVDAAQDFSGSRYTYYDANGHGTHTAGTIGARQNNQGVIGVAPECRLLIGKVLGDNGSGSGQGVALGIDWAVANGADLISMSLGSPEPDPDIHAAIIRAVTAGRFVVVAAGNEGPVPGVDTVDYPGRWDETVAVGAVDEQGHVAPFSSRGPEVDICAPGTNVLSTYLNGTYAKLSGTSMATPFVAGVVALAVAKHKAQGGATPLSTPAQLIEHLRAVAQRWQPGEGSGSGTGIIDPAAVLGLGAGGGFDAALKLGSFRISIETVRGTPGLFIAVGPTK